MKKYEGLFIFNIDGSESAVKDALDTVSAEITAQGGKVENIAKMGRQPFAHTPDKRVTSGYYANVAFEAPAAAIRVLRTRFATSNVVYRVSFTVGTKAVLPQEDSTPAAAPAAASAEVAATEGQA